MPGTLNGVRYSGRANRQRYEAVGGWEREPRMTNRACIVWVADLREKKTGHLYHEGAYKVEARSNGRCAYMFGETAWSDAQRLAEDMLQDLRRNGPPVDGLRDLMRF